MRLESGNTILDVGPFDAPTVLCGKFSRRITVDGQDRPDLPGVEKIIARWPDAASLITEPVDLVLCMQVIEHIADYQPFVEALFRVGERVIISLPWKWAADACKYHAHDPIDDEKLVKLIPWQPLSRYVVTEDDGVSRIILFYDEERIHADV